MKKLVIATMLVAVGSTAMAARNNVGSCGWGSKLFDGQSGVPAQVMAVTTNTLAFGNQTFGITFGSSGCTQDGVVTSSWRIAMYMDGNRVALARDAAAGQGESLDALATVIGVKPDDRAIFAATVKAHFAAVFADENLASNLKSMLSADERLAVYASAI